MRMSQHFPRRTRRAIDDELTAAHALLVRGGFIRNVAPGVFNLLPLGKKVHDRVRDIINEEMAREGVHNLDLCILQPRELWERTGRWDRYVRTRTMFHTTEAHTGLEFGLAPTAEDVVTALAASEISSHHDLPVILHQIGPKFRDEMRPRQGLLRCREFGMSDAYSFAADQAGMVEHFGLMRRIYECIFKRVGLRNVISVRADSGAIGGQGSSEFMALSEALGEDVLLTCNTCDYGANAEKADSRYAAVDYGTVQKPRRDVNTPNTRTVEELEELFRAEGITARHMVKTIVLTVNPDSDPYEVAVCMRGDLEINLVKVRNALVGADEVVPAAESVVIEATGAVVGFAGPLGLLERGKVRQILFDQSVQPMRNFLCGLNTTDYHALDVNMGVDIPVPDTFHNLHTAKAGHGCSVCEGTLAESHGIEVGHIFQLQTVYSDKVDATFTDAAGNEQVIWMGCYGIGTTRLVQAIVEQNRDDKGILWPEAVAPYDVVVVPVQWNNEVQRTAAELAYTKLTDAGLRVMLDDRDERLGVKLTDAELIGYPWIVIAGRETASGRYEVRRRDGNLPTDLQGTSVPIEWMLEAWCR